jgi:hypothetical protein
MISSAAAQQHKRSERQEIGVDSPGKSGGAGTEIASHTVQVGHVKLDALKIYSTRK